MKKELVSVIIPAYNRIDFLSKSLMSVYEQTYRPIELIVVDDHSQEDTKSLVLNFAKQYSDDNFEVKFLLNKKKGAPSARNYGFQESKGSVIQFLDSDDIILPHKLDVEIKHLPDFDIVYSKAQHTNEKLERTNEFWGSELTNTPLDYFNFSWQTMCAIYTRGAVLKIGEWDELLTINQDWDYCIRAIMTNLKIKHIKTTHSLFRHHSKERVGQNLSLEKIKGKENATKKIYMLLKKENKINGLLRKLYYKRFIFIIVQYGKIKAFNYKDKLLKFIENEFSKTIITKAFTINKTIIFTAVNKLYNLKENIANLIRNSHCLNL